MIARLRNVLNWGVFLITAIWAGVCVLGIIIGEYSILHFIGLFLLVSLPINCCWQIIQYVVWGQSRWFPWDRWGKQKLFEKRAPSGGSKEATSRCFIWFSYTSYIPIGTINKIILVKALLHQANNSCWRPKEGWTLLSQYRNLLLRWFGLWLTQEA